MAEELEKRLNPPKRAPWIFIGAALLLGGSSVFADVNMTLTGPGNNGALGNVYVGPYQGTINGVSTPIICDDFFDDSYLNEAWTATVSTFSNLSQTKFGKGNTGSQDGVTQTVATQYEEAAWLAQQLVNAPTSCGVGANCAGDIQFAMWEVFDSTGSNTPFSLLSGADFTNASWWLTQAQKQSFYAGEFSNVTIYTPVSCSAVCGTTLPQEFMVVNTPEPSEIALLGVDLSGASALLFLLYRRRARQL